MVIIPDDPQHPVNDPPLNAAEAAVMAAMAAIIQSDLPAKRINPIFNRLTLEVAVPSWDRASGMQLNDEQAIAWGKQLVAAWTRDLLKDEALIPRLQRGVEHFFYCCKGKDQGEAELIAFLRDDLRSTRRFKLGMGPASPEEYAQIKGLVKVGYKEGCAPKDEDDEDLIY